MKTVYLNIHSIVKMYKEHGIEHVIRYINSAHRADFVDNMAHDVYKKIKSKDIELVRITIEKYATKIK